MINEKYINPFESEGLWAPLMFAAGASGVNPFDYLLSFTQFSDEFGYSNLLTGAIEPLVTGRGQFGNELSMLERLQEGIGAAGPTSFTKDLPKILDPEVDAQERLKRTL